MKKYLLTLQIPLTALDDPSVRAQAQLILAMAEPVIEHNRVTGEPAKVGVKLHELDDGQAWWPRPVIFKKLEN
jgi:hypothetical protein